MSDRRAPATGLLPEARQTAAGARNDPGQQDGRARPVISFATDTFPAELAFEAWREQFGQLNEVIVARGAGFSGRSRFWQLGDFTVAVNETSAMRLVRSAAHLRRDDLDHWLLRVSAQGVVRSRSGERAFRSAPGELVVERLNEAYEDEWSADRWVMLVVPPGTCPEIEAGLAAMPRGPVGGVEAALLADFLLSLARRLPEALESDLPALAHTTQTMIAATFAGRHGAARESPLAARLRVERTIRASLASARLDPSRIAALAGVSRATLYRLLEDQGGVAAYVRRLRLEAVHAALCNLGQAHVPIARLAERAGFHSPAAFNRTFRAAFGASPGEVRERAARQDPPLPRAPDSSPFHRGFLDLAFPAGAPAH
ncbi:MAG: helix-turn-helix domain-containing protein [Geminicoccaceae bacterium]|nr:helix-turn-helix domain-containing protein [Geminicoccaceae bacterium]